MAYEISLLTDAPVPTFSVLFSEDVNTFKPLAAGFDLQRELAAASDGRISSRDFWLCRFRGTSYARLAQVLETGIDVSPPDAPFWADHLDKAMEYGGWPKLVLVFRADCLDRSFRQVDANIEPARLAELRQSFPHESLSQDGTRIWLSRFPPEAAGIA